MFVAGLMMLSVTQPPCNWFIGVRERGPAVHQAGVSSSYSLIFVSLRAEKVRIGGPSNDEPRGYLYCGQMVAVMMQRYHLPLDDKSYLIGRILAHVGWGGSVANRQAT